MPCGPSFATDGFEEMRIRKDSQEFGWEFQHVEGNGKKEMGHSRGLHS